MSRVRSFWAALASIEESLADEAGWVYLWTFTGADEEMRQNRRVQMRQWGKMVADRRWRELGWDGFRSTEQGTNGECNWHQHLVTSKRIDVNAVREIAGVYRFGRVNVKRLPRSRGAWYAAKYLTKERRQRGQRAWAALGVSKSVRCQDIEIFDQFKRYAVEGRSHFPKQGATGALDPVYWWSECLLGLAHQFMRRRFSNPWQPIAWDGSLIDRYGGIEGLSEASWRSVDRVFRSRDEAVLVDGKWEFGRGVVGAIYPRNAMYLGRWVPEFVVTHSRESEVVRTWERRQARHLVQMGCVPWWVREPGDVPAERPARPGDLVTVAFLREYDFADEKLCGEGVGYVEAIRPCAAASTSLEGVDDFEAEIDRICRESGAREGQFAENVDESDADSSFAICTGVGNLSSDE